MVREGRLGPGRRLPSTRRLAARIGLHRNTVAAAYRRLAARGLLEVRHGARARVAAGPAVEQGCGAREPPQPAGGVLAVAGDEGSARLMAAEISARIPDPADVRRAVPGTAQPSPRAGDAEGAPCRRLAGTLPGRAERGRLAVAFPGAAERRIAGGGENPLRWIRARQSSRPGVARALRRARPLDVVAVATESRLLREAILCDAARLRGGELSVRAVSAASTPGDASGGAALSRRRASEADLVIADFLAADALCGTGSSAGDADPVTARLVSAETLDEIAGRLAAGSAGGDRVPTLRGSTRRRSSRDR